ncbi:MAG: mandelate racemase/muconate lactonizing enzyme family protein [Alphaproteobacteria bacterium]|nr:mandelate racemase/muconate lactonizing enzyme family protein [Alphaproteobacteria bacterium]
MKIARVAATPLNVPLHIKLAGVDRRTTLSVCLVEVETDSGLTGHGLTAITEEEVIAAIVERVAGPAILSDDPLAHERIWDKLYWTLMPRGQTGYAAHALAAIDVALWDIKGKALGQPVWRLLGGAHPKVPVYATFGFGFFGREQLASVAKLWVSQGFKRLKMTVAGEALRHRDTRPMMDVIREDAARVAAVREAVGPDIELFIDANCNLDLYHATKLVEMIAPCRISFFEEPLTQNDVPGMAQLRRATGMALACGQNEGLAFRFRDLLAAQAIDYAQPNVCITGGFSQCVKIAGMAAAHNVSIANGGAWGFHNMHLQAGVANGTLVEHHYLAVELCRQIYRGLPEPKDGFFTMSEAPGLGFEPDRDAIREIAKLPLSGGRGKG